MSDLQCTRCCETLPWQDEGARQAWGLGGGGVRREVGGMQGGVGGGGQRLSWEPKMTCAVQPASGRSCTLDPKPYTFSAVKLKMYDSGHNAAFHKTASIPDQPCATTPQGTDALKLF